MLNLFLFPPTININYQKLRKKLMGIIMIKKMGKIKNIIKLIFNYSS
jgi:hypothetical protein